MVPGPCWVRVNSNTLSEHLLKKAAYGCLDLCLCNCSYLYMFLVVVLCILLISCVKHMTSLLWKCALYIF